MLTWIKRIIQIALLFIIGLALHYYLPQRDIVQITGTEVKRMNIEKNSPFWDQSDSGTADGSTRDVRFINAAGEKKANGKRRVYVYRNEDTNFSWPPYLKFNSGDLSAEAQSFAREEDKWVAVTHYGWRSQLFSVFPNAVRIRQVEGPDVRLVPWFNIVFLTILGIVFLWLWSMWRNFRKTKIEPVVEEIIDNAEGAEAEIKERAQALKKKGWFKR